MGRKPLASNASSTHVWKLKLNKCHLSGIPVLQIASILSLADVSNLATSYGAGVRGGGAKENILRSIDNF